MIRIAPMNTWKGEGDYQRRLSLLAGGLQEEKVDILCCQEAFATDDDRYNTAAVLAKDLGMTCSFSAARRKKRLFQGKHIECTSGMAILTGADTWMLYSGSFSLPESKKDRGRVAQFAVIRKNGNTILVINVHLSHLQNGRTLRRKQMREVLLHASLERPYAAVIICGDFNAAPEEDDLKVLRKHAGYLVYDGFSAGGGDPETSTMVTGPTENRKRVDHIFVLEKKKNPVARLAMKNSRLILNRQDANGIFPSDHYGVALDLEIERILREDTCQVRHYASFAQPWRRAKKGELVPAF